jgi:hypothetical protein
MAGNHLNLAAAVVACAALHAVEVAPRPSASGQGRLGPRGGQLRRLRGGNCCTRLHGRQARAHQAPVKGAQAAEALRLARVLLGFAQLEELDLQAYFEPEHHEVVAKARCFEALELPPRRACGRPVRVVGLGLRQHALELRHLRTQCEHSQREPPFPKKKQVSWLMILRLDRK